MITLGKSKRHNLHPAKRKGQSVVEYTFVIAFTCFLIALAFALTSGTLYNAISQSHSSIVNQFTILNNASADYK